MTVGGPVVCKRPDNQICMIEALLEFQTPIGIGIYFQQMLFRLFGKLDPCKYFICSQRVRFFLSVFIIDQIIDNITVIESFALNQVRAASALREKQLNAHCRETINNQ
ncbi:hypothetical protein TNCV_2600901 [Trichonephila clavipes]|nr:hypothetical protein TNCV_2600901 [Trichonephila clavipes]